MSIAKFITAAIAATAVLGFRARRTQPIVTKPEPDDRDFERLVADYRIELAEAYELTFWTKRLGVSKTKLKRAVSAVGNRAESVREHLHSAR